MKQFVPAAFALSLVFSGVLHAQTTAPATGSSTTPAVPSTTPTLPPTTAPTITGPAVTAPPVTTPGATSNAPSTSAAPAAVTTTAEPTRTTEAPVPGANSFTEGQARARIEERGFAQVTDLKKDDQGIWRGTAMKDGRSVSVAIDYQGNIVGQ